MSIHSEKSYELIDSGEERKLERFGDINLDRPEPQALWPKSQSEWKSDAVFSHGKGASGSWSSHIDDWQIDIGGLNFLLKLLPSKHVGIFPEVMEHSDWLKEKSKDKKVLNLFANTGAASLVCARAGAEVVHVDALQFNIDWAMKNRDLSGLTLAPIRFIADDVRKFVEREIKRGNSYDVVILDPPVYGKGSKVWKIEKDLVPLLAKIKRLNPKAVLINGYASIYSHITYGNLLKTFGDNVVSGELTIREKSGRELPAGIFALWDSLGEA